MAKHRAISQHSLKGRTVIAGVLASGALMVAAPAAIALADQSTGPGSSKPAPAAQRTIVRTTPGAARDAAIGRFIASTPFGQLLVRDLSQTPQGQKVLNRLGLGGLQRY